MLHLTAATVAATAATAAAVQLATTLPVAVAQHKLKAKWQLHRGGTERESRGARLIEKEWEKLKPR